MRLQTEFRIAMVILTTALATSVCHGQGATTSNPGQYLAIVAGNDAINNKVSSQTKKQTAIAGIQAELNASTTQMKKWEQEYNSYLKTGDGYAKSILQACQVYIEGMQTLTALWEVYAATKINTQGVFANMSMNNLYMEIASEFIKTYRTIKIVAKGGSSNMLNGAERTQVLWGLSEGLQRLNQKLRRLAVCISTYSFEDVWNRAIAGKIEKSNGLLAKEARNRMRRAATSVAKMYKMRQNSKTW